MNWRAASIKELQMVLWDSSAHPVHRQEAEAELMRRRPKRWSKMNQNIRRVYPK